MQGVREIAPVPRCLPPDVSDQPPKEPTARRLCEERGLRALMARAPPESCWSLPLELAASTVWRWWLWQTHWGGPLNCPAKLGLMEQAKTCRQTSFPCSTARGTADACLSTHSPPCPLQLLTEVMVAQARSVLCCCCAPIAVRFPLPQVHGDPEAEPGKPEQVGYRPSGHRCI